MKKISFILSATVLAFCLNACGNTCNTASITTPDWVGTYAGVMPCADCPGIQTIVDLLPDSTYTLQTRYIDRSEEMFTQSGKFLWDTQNNTIALDNLFIKQLLVEDHSVRVLFDGQEESLIPIELYTLMKTDMELAGKYWKLVELNGNPVEVDQSPRDPHIVLDIYTHSFTGSTSCNRMMGSYQLTAPGKIVFSQAAATQMMCLDMEIENQFLQIFDSIDGYLVDGDTLTLLNESGAPLARFSVVPTQ